MGMDRSITILKSSNNKFAILQEDKISNEVKTAKPPPINLRQQNTNELVNYLISIIGENSVYAIPIKRGTVFETKIQVGNDHGYRKIAAEFKKEKVLYS